MQNRATRTLHKSLSTSTLTIQCTRPPAELQRNAVGMCQDPNFWAPQLLARKWLLAINYKKKIKTQKKPQNPNLRPQNQKLSETAAEICLWCVSGNILGKV